MEHTKVKKHQIFGKIFKEHCDSFLSWSQRYKIIQTRYNYKRQL